MIYDSENVAVFKLHKPYNFLCFEFIEFSEERAHLKQRTDVDIESRLVEALDLKSKGYSNTDIAKKFGVSEGAVRKWFKKAENNV